MTDLEYQIKKLQTQRRVLLSVAARKQKACGNSNDRHEVRDLRSAAHELKLEILKLKGGVK